MLVINKPFQLLDTLGINRLTKLLLVYVRQEPANSLSAPRPHPVVMHGVLKGGLHGILSLEEDAFLQVSHTLAYLRIPHVHWRAILDSSLSSHCLLYTSPSPRDQRGSRMPSSA